MSSPDFWGEEQAAPAPLVTVVVPVYNGERYIEETLNSVIQSRHRPLEVIVVDDGSTDASANVAQRVLDSSEVKYSILRQKNSGEACAVNRGIAQAEGQFLMVLSADDLIESELITKALTMMMEDSNIGVVYPDQIIIDGAGAERVRQEKPDYSVAKLFGELKCLPGVGTLVRASVLEGRTPRDERYPLISDFVMWLQLSNTTNFRRLPGIYGIWRSHSDGTTTRMNSQLWGKQLIEAVDEICSDSSLGAPHLALRKKALAKAYLRGGLSQRFPTNLLFLVRSLAKDPALPIRLAFSLGRR